jgi:glutamate-1-semialdehyde 2,1-aminomutase
VSDSKALKEKAKRLIPGATMLLSKNPDIYSDNYPGYYTDAKGCKIKAVDGKWYKDFSFMGIGANVLGYAHPAVNDAVISAVQRGNMSTMNCPEEIELAELLNEMHHWKGSIRTARTGGEAMMIAVRIARASTGKSKVMVSGYHGWHDWYLSANLENRDNLNNHLRKNLNTAGVPKELISTCIPFDETDFKRKFDDNYKDIAAIILEPMRYEEPKYHYISTINILAQKYGIPIIADEISSGWRSFCGGVSYNVGLHPDMVVYSKAISNGYPFSVVYGRPELMKAAEKTFISSTYWTERIGTTAALATIREMRKLDFSQQIKKSDKVRDIWRECSEYFNMEMEIHGSLALSSFTFKDDHERRRRYLTDKMLEKGFIFMNNYYASFAHGWVDIAQYQKALQESFAELILGETK